MRCLKSWAYKLYKLDFKSSVKKELKSIDVHNLKFIKESLYDFTNSFNHHYEQELLKTGKIKKLKGQKDELFRLKLRTYRVIYKKENQKLIILVLSIKSRESSYKK